VGSRKLSEKGYALSAAALAGLLLGCLGGCAGPREQALASSPVRNRVLDISQVLSRMALPEGEKELRKEWGRGDSQSTHLLLLSKDFKTERGCQEEHDLTLVCVGGSAIVEIEGRRHFIEPGDAVVIPRLHAYSILPHRSETDFAAIVVCSPPWEDGDWVALEER